MGSADAKKFAQNILQNESFQSMNEYIKDINKYNNMIHNKGNAINAWKQHQVHELHRFERNIQKKIKSKVLSSFKNALKRDGQLNYLIHLMDEAEDDDQNFKSKRLLEICFEDASQSMEWKAKLKPSQKIIYSYDLSSIQISNINENNFNSFEFKIDIDKEIATILQKESEQTFGFLFRPRPTTTSSSKPITNAVNEFAKLYKKSIQEQEQQLQVTSVVREQMINKEKINQLNQNGNSDDYQIKTNVSNQMDAWKRRSISSTKYANVVDFITKQLTQILCESIEMKISNIEIKIESDDIKRKIAGDERQFLSASKSFLNSIAVMAKNNTN